MMQGDREAAVAERARIVAREAKLDQERLDDAAARADARETSAHGIAGWRVAPRCQ